MLLGSNSGVQCVSTSILFNKLILFNNICHNWNRYDNININVYELTSQLNKLLIVQLLATPTKTICI